MNDRKLTEPFPYPPKTLFLSNPLEHLLHDGTGDADDIRELNELA